MRTQPSSPLSRVPAAAALLLSTVAITNSCQPTDGEQAASTDDLVATELEAERVVGLSIAYHDPGSQWGTAPLELDLEESRPDGSVRQTRFEYHPPSRYRVTTARGGKALDFEIQDETLVADSMIDEGGNLTEASALRTRNYYLYLYGLPMKIQDEAAVVSQSAERTRFEGQEALAVRVTYEEPGSDIWYFYFDPSDYRLIGYKFHHDEAKGDGETILLEGIAEVGGFRLPAARTWYTNLDRKLLGTDTIVVSQSSVPQD